jgi:hypothetical protein
MKATESLEFLFGAAGAGCRRDRWFRFRWLLKDDILFGGYVA